jgi:hypothetical protein
MPAAHARNDRSLESRCWWYPPLVRFFVFKVLMPCPECGSTVALEGPSLGAVCNACKSNLELLPENWMGALEFRKYEAEFSLTEGMTRGSSLTNGELRLLVRWGPARPVCPGCSALMPAEEVPPGGDGRLSCKCGQSMTTFPAPEWLRAVVPTAVQLFGAARDGVPEGLVAAESTSVTKPVLFACPQCGAPLHIAAESPRILTCNYCDTDLYLPDALWHALHPIKKRTPFWVAFDE